VFVAVVAAQDAADANAPFPVPCIPVGLEILGRAELAFVVMDIGYVEHRILSTETFYTLMFIAFWLNVSVPLSISRWKRRYA